MIKLEHFKRYIIEDTLRDMDKVKPGAYSEDAVALLLGTAAVESGMGYHLVQLGGGPGRGPLQVEPETEYDIWNNYLRYRTELRRFVVGLMGQRASELRVNHTGQVIRKSKLERDAPLILAELTHNFKYNTTMARIKYIRSSMKLPNRRDVRAMADCWEIVYQGDPSRTIGQTADDFVIEYNKYVRKR